MRGLVDAEAQPDQDERVDQTSAADLPQMARDAVQGVAGADEVEKVSVEFGQDSTDQPALYFVFLIDQGQDGPQAGVVRTRLIQRLRDALLARGYEHYPIVQILSRADWQRRFGA